METEKKKKLNPYFKHIANADTFQLAFSGILTLFAVVFFATRIANTPIDSPLLNVFLTPMMSLITLWIPVHMMRSKKKKSVPLLPISSGGGADAPPLLEANSETIVDSQK